MKFSKKEELENQRLTAEFHNRVLQIRKKNYLKFMNERLIPFCRHLELTKTGLLLSDVNLFNQAHQMFLEGKTNGRFDEFNNLVEK